MKLLRATALLLATVPALPSSAQAAHWRGHGWHGGFGGFGLGFAAAAIIGSALAAPYYGYGPYYGYYGWHRRHWHYGPHRGYGWWRWHHWRRHRWHHWRRW